MMICLSADVDGDANRAVPGRIESASPGYDEARYDACLEGFQILLDLLGESGIRSTLFLEGRVCRRLADSGIRSDALAGHEIACHGYAHEDFTGRESGIPMSRGDCLAAINHSIRTIRETTGRDPAGFRAPYTRINKSLFEAVLDAGFRYDSSLTCEMKTCGLKPFRPASGSRELIELPLARTKDSKGRTRGSYLWPVFEKRRSIEEYIMSAEALSGISPNGFIQFALHPWHLVVDENGRRFSEKRIAGNVDALRRLCRAMSDRGSFRAVTLDEVCASSDAGERVEFDDAQGVC